MKSISSHVLDGVRGSDATDLRVSAYCLAASGERRKIAEVRTDMSGRLTSILVTMILRLAMSLFFTAANISPNTPCMN